MVSTFSFKELYMYYYYIWLYMYTVVLLYTKGVPWLWKVEPITNLFISVVDIQMYVWGPNVSSRSGKFNQSWAV
jgi:hypothetical protein